MANNYKIYKFNRGTKYSCQVLIHEDGHTTFNNIVAPPSTPNYVIEKMMDDAEEDALKKYNEDKKRTYTGSTYD